MKKVAFLLLVAAVAFAASPTALTGGPATGMPPASTDALGSVINSFTMTGTGAPYALGIVRDDTYVYGVLYQGSGSGYLRSFTPAGSTVGSVALSVSGTLRDGDACDLGAGYCSVITIVSGTSGMVYKVVKSTGAIANSFSVTASATNPMNIAYIGSAGYYAIAGGYTGTTINMYTTSGSSAGTWTISSGQTYMGALAWSPMVNNASGSYVVYSAWTAGIGHTVFAYPSASMVGSSNWGIVSGGNANGSCCGLGSPGTYGTTFWANMYTGSALAAYQYDLGNSGVGIAPTSLGKVKSLYR